MATLLDITSETVRLLRPFARLLFSTRRPPTVDLRFMKPNFIRRALLGWYVRFVLAILFAVCPDISGSNVSVKFISSPDGLINASNHTIKLASVLS